jgi:E3 ubiquitin-protein ligase SIAH1
MDAFVSKALVPCPHEANGCRASVAYYLAGDHGSACAQAPCACGEPGCAFLGSPPMLLAHLAAAPHSWPVDKLQYGEALRIRVPDTEPRRLLVAEEDGGERVFVLAVGDRAARAIPVRVACVRAPDAAAAGPQFTLKMWATGCKAPASGKVESVLVDMEVPSAAAAGAVAADEEGTFLLVPRNMLRGASSQLHLSVRIDKA